MIVGLDLRVAIALAQRGSCQNRQMSSLKCFSTKIIRQPFQMWKEFMKTGESTPPALFCNGLRYITPYKQIFRVHCKDRWINKSIYDVMCHEFYVYNKQEYYV